MRVRPPYPRSTFITGVTCSPFRIHKGDGDMWPLTWVADDHPHGVDGNI